MNIGYFADGPWSHRALNQLMENPDLTIKFICARHEAPDPVLRQAADKNGIPFLITDNVNSDYFIRRVKGFDCHLLVSMSFNQIFRKKIIDLAPEGIINCHAGKLPFYRGRNVLNWALINDEKEFGITVHYVDEGVDTGDIILQKIYPITDDDDYRSLLEVAYSACSDVLYDAIMQIRMGHAQRIQQSLIHPVGTFCSRRREGDEIIDWNMSSRELFNFVRAICFPGPRAQTNCKGHKVYINKVELLEDAPEYRDVSGSILKKENKKLLVKTSDSLALVTDWESDVLIRAGDRFQ